MGGVGGRRVYSREPGSAGTGYSVCRRVSSATLSSSGETRLCGKPPEGPRGLAGLLHNHTRVRRWGFVVSLASLPQPPGRR